jgi:hypothetical protein
MKMLHFDWIISVYYFWTAYAWSMRIFGPTWSSFLHVLICIPQWWLATYTIVLDSQENDCLLFSVLQSMSNFIDVGHQSSNFTTWKKNHEIYCPIFEKKKKPLRHAMLAILVGLYKKWTLHRSLSASHCCHVMWMTSEEWYVQSGQ